MSPLLWIIMSVVARRCVEGLKFMTTRGQVAEIGGVGTYMTKALSEVRQLRQPE